MDEAGFHGAMSSTNSMKVVVGTESRQDAYRLKSDFREHVSIVVVIGAEVGADMQVLRTHCMPISFVFPRSATSTRAIGSCLDPNNYRSVQLAKHAWRLLGIPPARFPSSYEFLIASNESGNVNSAIVLNLFKTQIFPRVKDLIGPGLHCILQMDKHATHLTPELMALCEAHSTIPSFPPSHSSHFMQALDDDPFTSLKGLSRVDLDFWFQALHKADRDIRFEDFPWILQRALELSFTPDKITKAFKHTGFFPFNPGLVLSKFAKGENVLDFASYAAGQDQLAVVAAAAAAVGGGDDRAADVNLLTATSMVEELDAVSTLLLSVSDKIICLNTQAGEVGEKQKVLVCLFTEILNFCCEALRAARKAHHAAFPDDSDSERLTLEPNAFRELTWSDPLPVRSDQRRTRDQGRSAHDRDFVMVPVRAEHITDFAKQAQLDKARGALFSALQDTEKVPLPRQRGRRIGDTHGVFGADQLRQSRALDLEQKQKQQRKGNKSKGVKRTRSEAAMDDGTSAPSKVIGMTETFLYNLATNLSACASSSSESSSLPALAAWLSAAARGEQSVIEWTSGASSSLSSASSSSSSAAYDAAAGPSSASSSSSSSASSSAAAATTASVAASLAGPRLSGRIRKQACASSAEEEEEDFVNESDDTQLWARCDHFVCGKWRKVDVEPAQSEKFHCRRCSKPCDECKKRECDCPG